MRSADAEALQTEVKILKLRPVSRAPGHLGDREWISLLAECNLHASRPITRLRYPTNVDFPQYSKWILDELEAGPVSGPVIIDACMSDSGRELELCLESLHKSLSEWIEKDRIDVRVLIVTGLNGRRPSPIFELVDDGPWHGAAWVLTTDGTIHGAEGGPFRDVVARLRPLIDPNGDHVSLRRIRANLLRIRGVYRDVTAPGKYFGYKYMLDTDAHGVLAELIKRYVLDRNIQIILVDKSSSTWMSGVQDHLEIALLHQDTEIFAADLLTSDDRDTVCASGKNVLILCGATISGGTANRLCARLSLAPDSKRIHRMAILCDLQRQREQQDQHLRRGGGDVWGTADMDGRRWSFLLSVPFVSYRGDNWRVRAAGMLNEIGDLSATQRAEPDLVLDDNTAACPATQIGLWDLLHEVGEIAENEGSDLSEFEWREPKRAVRYLPNFSNLDPATTEDEFSDYDANWLAEAVIRRFCQLTGTTARRDLVVLAPESRNGVEGGSAVEKVLDAMLHTRRVRAIRVPRESIYGGLPLRGRDADYARRWDCASFVAFDETTASMRTLQGLAEVIGSSGGELVASASLVDVGWPGRETYGGHYFALCRWQHLAEVPNA